MPVLRNTQTVNHHRFPHSLCLCLCAIAFIVAAVSSKPALADDGEFWDAAVASMLRTKRLNKTYFQLKIGMGGVTDLDTPNTPPSKWRLLGQGYFYGVKLDRYKRLFSLYGNVALGMENNKATSVLDAYRFRMSVFNYLNGGAFSLGILAVEREKALNQQFAAKFRSFEYAAGGAMKVFAVSLTTSLLGYEFRRFYARDGYEVAPNIAHKREDYNGLLIFNLTLKLGLVLGHKTRFSFESNLESDIEFSYPRQKDIGTLFEMVGHFNNRVLPMDLSLVAGHKYSVDDRDGEDGPAFHDSYYYTTALIGLRF